MRRPRPFSLNECTTIRDDCREHVDPTAMSPSARRRRSLHRGALRFVRDVCAEDLEARRLSRGVLKGESTPQRVHRVLLVALTMEKVDPELARGAIEHTFHQLRDRHADRLGARAARAPRRARAADRRLRYLWWPEFQRRGALHYHAIVVDPPFDDVAGARRWFSSHWRGADGQALAGIQAWTEFRSAAWFRSRGGDYVLKDVRKLGGKQYEQDYSRMPRGWRTFRSHQLRYLAAEHQEHETKAHTVCTAPAGATFVTKRLEIWIYRVDHHVPQDGGCRLHRPRQKGRVPRGGGVSPLSSSNSRQ